MKAIARSLRQVLPIPRLPSLALASLICLLSLGLKFAVNDGEFGKQQDHSRVSIDRGWIEDSYQLRLFFGTFQKSVSLARVNHSSRCRPGTRDESEWGKRDKITIFGADKDGKKRSFRPYVTPINVRSLRCLSPFFVLANT